MSKTVLLRAATVAQPVITDTTIITEITSYINNYRQLNQAPPLKWDGTIATFSQNWANYLLTNNLFQHSGTQLYGENLAYFQGYGVDVLTLLKKAVDLWYNEISLYDFKNPGFSSGTGHFTCLVWVASTTFGMGFSFDASTQTVDVVFNTSPPGNVIGQFVQNVLPTISGTTPGTPSSTIPVVVVPTPTTPPTPPAVPICDCDKVHVLSALYIILKDLKANKSRLILENEIKTLINSLGSI